jgi:hypothetical protein
MVERGMSSLVSGEHKVELKYLSFVERKVPLMGRPAFPFIGQGKDPWYKSEREKGRKIKRKEGREERWSGQPRSCAVLPSHGRVLRVL